MSTPEFTPTDEDVRGFMASATAALQETCMARGIRLDRDLSRDLVTLLASKDVSAWSIVKTAGHYSAEFTRMIAVVKFERVENDKQLELLKRAMAFTLRAKRYWLAKFCPVCWAWTGVLWVLGFRGPTKAEADYVAHGE